MSRRPAMLAMATQALALGSLPTTREPMVCSAFPVEDAVPEVPQEAVIRIAAPAPTFWAERPNRVERRAAAFRRGPR